MDWKKRQKADPYVKRAQREGYRARSAFKLIELDEKDRFFRPGQRVVDLGAAPGGWCQVALERVGPHGMVTGLDILPMEPIEGVTFIQGDFREDEPWAVLEQAMAGQRSHLGLTDMNANMTGMSPPDQARSIYLADVAAAIARD